MSRQYDLIIFDWDGTLADSTAHIVGSIEGACSDLGIPLPSRAASRSIIGLGLQEALMQLLPGFPAERYPALAERYRYHYLAGDHGVGLFDEVTEGLAELAAAELMLAVATGKSRVGLQRALAAAGLHDTFHATRCADEGFGKPHPGMVEYLLDTLNVPADRALMIGDTVHDMQLAENSRIDALAVTYGAAPREDLLVYEPRACLNSFAEVRAWLRHVI